MRVKLISFSFYEFILTRTMLSIIPHQINLVTFFVNILNIFMCFFDFDTVSIKKWVCLWIKKVMVYWNKKLKIKNSLVVSTYFLFSQKLSNVLLSWSFILLYSIKLINCHTYISSAQLFFSELGVNIFSHHKICQFWGRGDFFSFSCVVRFH